MRYIILLGLAAAAQTGLCGTIRSIGELKAALSDLSSAGSAFDVAGEVQSYHPDYLGAWLYAIRDGTNSCYVSEPSVPGKTRQDPHSFGLLDRIRVSGRISIVEGKPRAVFDAAKRLSKGDLANIPELDTDGLTTAKHLKQVVRLRGRIRDASRDDTDATYICMTLCDEKGLVPLMVIEPPQFPSDFLPLIGAEVVVTGICTDGSEGLHRHFGPYLGVSGLENIVASSPPDTFSTAPDITSLGKAHPRHIAAAGFHQAKGVVLAAWDGNAFLMRTSEGLLVRVRLQRGTPPAFGDNVRVLGLPVTDSFHLNLVNATWEPTSDSCRIADVPTDVRAADLTTDRHGYPQLMMHYYGKPVRLSGVIRYIPDTAHGHVPMQIESSGQIIAIDDSMLAQTRAPLEIGCRVSIAGICIMDMGNSDIEFGTHARAGLLIVPRTADDIHVLSRPPWWTPGRLFVLAGAMLAVLLGIFAWNMALRRKAERRGRELADEQLAHVASELKVVERTRLAVELHDSLSQTLTGISMGIDSALDIAGNMSEELKKQLNYTSKTVEACRTELRNCLWDLRSQALEESDMNAAIQLALSQIVSKTALNVRFAVPRARLSDKTTHTILRIIRELATNAVRHGHASSIKIAGSIDGGKLRFSVADNGTGFNPDHAAGVAEGHFGLEGIRERVDHLDGEVDISSSPGHGAKVTVAFDIPSAKMEEGQVHE